MRAPQAELNFYDLLGLSPDDPWDRTTFEKALAGKRSRWNKDKVSGVGTRKGDAETRLTWASAHERDMLENPAFRKAQADAIRTAQAADSVDQAAQLDAAITLLSAKGYVLETEVAGLVSTYKSIIGEGELRKRIGASRIRPDAAPSVAPQEKLEPATWKSITALLAKVGARDLYEFVQRFGWEGGIAPASGLSRVRSEELVAAANDIRERYLRKGSMNRTAENDAVKELAGYCLSIFRVPADRAKYDASLADAHFAGLLDRVDLAAQGPRAINRAALDALLRMAGQEFGLDLADSEERIRARAAEKGWFVAERETGAGVSLWQCGQCRAVNASADQFCCDCGSAATYPCPRCAGKLPSANRSCGGCGFPVGNEPWVRMFLAKSRQLAATDPGAAIAQLEEAASGWPATAGPLGGEIASVRRELAAAVRKQAETMAEIRRLVEARSYYAARATLATLAVAASAEDPELTTVRAQIERSIIEAERLLGAARACGGSGEEVVSAYQEVLRICRDCEPARAALTRTPPLPPESLTATVRGHAVALEWSPSPSRGIQYAVVRKTGTRPSGFEDGIGIGIVPATRIDDASPEIGAPLYYAVFADREGIRSSNAAHASGSVLVVQEVDALVAQVGERRVHLRWRPPANARRVFAVRSSSGRPPSGPPDGMRLDSADRTQVVDTGLDNGRPYYYAVYVEFDGVTGPVLSRGASITATPQTPPTPIDDLKIEGVANGSSKAVRVSWDPPRVGEVRILKSAQPLAFAVSVIPADELARYGESLVSLPPLIDSWVPMQVVHYTAAVVLGGTAYLGRSNRFVGLEDVTGLRADNYGAAILLTWDWPKGCGSVRVSYSTRAWPSTADTRDRPLGADETVRTVTRAEYDRAGAFEVTSPARVDHFFVVQAATVADQGTTVLSPGTSAGARIVLRLASQVKVEYEIRRPRFGGVPQLVLRTDKEADIPAFMFVRKAGPLPPLNRNDGECVLRTEETSHVARELSFTLPEMAEVREAYGKLFLRDDVGYTAVRVLHPPTLDRVRL